MSGHKFGGAWTEVKLDAISAYFEYYNNVLRTQPRLDRPFRRWYIDAFAGSGSRTAEIARGGLLEGQPLSLEQIELDGSARKALLVDPPFDRLLFIEPHRGRFKDLAALREDYPGRVIDCRRGDANQEIAAIFSAGPWHGGRIANWTDRAVVFLDPYGMAVDWSTLQLLANTRAVDVWYLFPLEAVNRQLAHDLDRVDANKQVRLDQIFGTSAWREELYHTQVSRDLFDVLTERSGRQVNKRQIEQYAISRLRTIFKYVSDPLPLINEADRQLFSLLCLANPATDAAEKLIKRGVNWVFKQYGPASRRKSSH
ncbi:three-Cys-motif partner protein TcmP [uncultured Sphingomonas sp.]|uniref:three-Cys-motif partner protein TcmP n=1 Tax=uncultured Sphingomonas sp. TaxID=158754 RepID=UPI0025FE0587|nr:three-Cys-motif partner protein TcmP [uncultured Sphingomonas sp.]